MAQNSAMMQLRCMTMASDVMGLNAGKGPRQMRATPQNVRASGHPSCPAQSNGRAAHLNGRGCPPSCLSVQLTSTSEPAFPSAMDTWWQKRCPFT